MIAFFCCAAALSFSIIQLLLAAAFVAAVTAAALRRSISAGVRRSGGAGPRVESPPRTDGGAPGRATIAAGTRGAEGRTIPALGLGTTSRRPRKAPE